MCTCLQFNGGEVLPLTVSPEFPSVQSPSVQRNVPDVDLFMLDHLALEDKEQALRNLLGNDGSSEFAEAIAVRIFCILVGTKHNKELDFDSLITGNMPRGGLQAVSRLKSVYRRIAAEAKVVGLVAATQAAEGFGDDSDEGDVDESDDVEEEKGSGEPFQPMNS